MQKECVSVNVGPPMNDKFVCELSDSDHLQNPGDLKTRRDFTYRGIEVGIVNKFYKYVKRQILKKMVSMIRTMTI